MKCQKTYDLIIENEIRLFTRNEPVDVLEQLIDESFFEYGKSGQIFNKKEVIYWLGKDSQTSIQGSDFKAQHISQDVILLTYISIIKKPDNHETRCFRSSLWRNQGYGWQMVFHQASRI